MTRRIMLWQTSTFFAWFLGMTIGLTLGEVLSRNLNMLAYGNAGFPVGSLARNVFTGATIGLLCGILQVRLILENRLSPRRWILGNVMALGGAFLLAEILGFPVVSDIEYGILFSFGFDLPPLWSPFAREVGLGNNTLGGPISAIVVGVSAGVILFLFFRNERNHLLHWVFGYGLGPALGLIVGIIPIIFSDELLVVAAVTGLVVGITQGLSVPRYLTQNH